MGYRMQRGQSFSVIDWGGGGSGHRRQETRVQLLSYMEGESWARDTRHKGAVIVCMPGGGADQTMWGIILFGQKLERPYKVMETGKATENLRKLGNTTFESRKTGNIGKARKT